MRLFHSKLDRAGLSGYSRNEAEPFERHDHLVYQRGRNLEMPLHICLGRRAPIDLCVAVDEREILSLLLGESHCWVMAPQLVQCSG